MNLSDDSGSGPEGVTAWQASAATDMSDEPAPLRARWGGVRDGDREGATSSADDADDLHLRVLRDPVEGRVVEAPAVVQMALVVDVGDSATTFSPAPPPDLPVPSPSPVTSAPSVTPLRPLTYDAPPAASPGTATRTETPVDAAWLQARERALIAVRQDFSAARDRALASAASGPSAADPAWNASVGMDAEGRFIAASDVPMFHWVDSQAPALITYGDDEGSQERPGVWMNFDEETFAKGYQAQAGAPLQALAALYRTDVPALLQLPDLWRIAITDHAINAGPAPSGVAMGNATELHMLDLCLDDPEISALITQFGGTPAPATSALAREQVRLYGQHRFEQLSLLGVAQQSVRDQYIAAMNEARTQDGPGSSQKPKTLTTTDESGRTVTLTMVATGLRDEEGPATTWREDAQGTPVMEKSFDPDVFTAWYTQQAGLANRAFASFYGQSHSTSTITTNGNGEDAGAEMLVTSGRFDKANWGISISPRGCSMDQAELVSINLNDPPDLHDRSAVGFDLEVGWATSVYNIDEGRDWLQAVATIIVVAVVAYVSAGTAGPAAASAMGLTTTTTAATVGTMAYIGGMAVSAAVTGAATSLAAGMMSGNLSLKSVLQGALAGALTGGLMAQFAPMVTAATSTTVTTAEGIVGTVPTAATQVANIALRSTVQGGIQALLGGSFKDGAIAGFASGLAQSVTEGMLQGVAQAVNDGAMVASIAPAANMFARLVGSAIRAAANPDDPLSAFASEFLGEMLNQLGAPVPVRQTAFDDDGNLNPGIVNANLTPDQQKEQLRLRLIEQGLPEDQAARLAMQTIDSMRTGAVPAPAPKPTQDVGSSPDVENYHVVPGTDSASSDLIKANAEKVQRDIADLAAEYGGIDKVPASELRALVGLATSEVSNLPYTVDRTVLAGDLPNGLWYESTKQVATAAGVVAGLFQGVGDTVIGLGQLALTASLALEYIQLGGEAGYGRVIAGGKQAYDSLLGISAAVGQIAKDPSYYLGATVASAVDKIQGALDTANVTGDRSDWFLYGAAVGRVTFDVAGLVLGEEGLASGAANVASRLATFVELRAASRLPGVLVPNPLGVAALPELTAVSPAPAGGISATKVNSVGYALMDFTPAERNLALQVSAGQDVAGVLTETLLSSIAKRQGLTELPGGKYGINNSNGFDHVLVGADGTVTLLIDSKQMHNGAVTLSKGAGNFTQLSTDWVRAVLSNLDQTSPAAIAVQNALTNGTLVKGVAAVDRASGSLVIARVGP